MAKRELFVFAGQSNMMGACTYPASEQIYFKRSYEYLHKPKRLGKKSGDFKNSGFPSGEFSYRDLETAYQRNTVIDDKSTLNDYAINTFFCPSMCNLKSEEGKEIYTFGHFCENTAPFGVTLAPFVVREWENLGHKCLYTHMAKGGVSIKHYFDVRMIEKLNELILEYNKASNKKLTYQEVDDNAAQYFFEKIDDFIIDSKKKFPNDDLGERCFFWLQGETDASWPKDLYKLYLKVLWKQLKLHGFTRFFCIRVGYWMNDNIVNIMKAQEEFCMENSDAYMLTRICSYMPMPGQDLDKWFAGENIDEYYNCRDSYYGFENHHINEKGFIMIANAMMENLSRVLINDETTILEKEKCALML